MRGSDHWSPYCVSSGMPDVSRARSASTETTLAFASSEATPELAASDGNVTAYIESAAMPSPAVAPAAPISASWSVSDVPEANVTMYGTSGAVGAAGVVVGALVVVGA